MINLILLIITIHTLYYFIYDYIFNDSIYINSTNNFEPVKIYPHFFFLKKIYNNLFIPLKPVLQNLDNNVSFLDIENNIRTRLFIMGCDWCSICNGIVETAKENIIKNPELINKINFEKLEYINKYLDYILIDRKEQLSHEQLILWCNNTFGHVTTKLLLLSSIYLKFELIELRWCPFKRSKKLYYKNKDNRYLEPTEQIIYQVGKILSQNETITCNNCPKIVNNEWKYTKSNTKSIFQPFLDYMIKEINENT